MVESKVLPLLLNFLPSHLNTSISKLLTVWLRAYPPHSSSTTYYPPLLPLFPILFRVKSSPSSFITSPSPWLPQFLNYYLPLHLITSISKLFILLFYHLPFHLITSIFKLLTIWLRAKSSPLPIYYLPTNFITSISKLLTIWLRAKSSPLLPL